MNFLDKIKKHKIVIILAIIILVGIFLRTYNLESWLFFQSDQARDLNLVNRAVENGPGWLPLLGPKAGGTYLRLGPVFYYFEYLSALIFGTSSPAIVVFPDLLFSILSIFGDMCIADLIDSFKDVQKVLHVFFPLFEKWYVED